MAKAKALKKRTQPVKKFNTPAEKPLTTEERLIAIVEASVPAGEQRVVLKAINHLVHAIEDGSGRAKAIVDGLLSGALVFSPVADSYWITVAYPEAPKARG